MKLEGKVAIVTGSSQGIGSGIALKFAEEGADVVVNYLKNDEKAETVADKIRNSGRQALVVRADASKSTDVNGLVQKTLDTFGNIDILVNNAGIFIGGEIAQLKEDIWDRVMAVNLKGVFLCCQAVGKYMITSKVRGSIINIASISGRLLELKDLGSDSGTYHNGDRVERAVLGHADRLTVGSVTFEVRFAETDL